ncbi:unnamed protein product [Prorocentrum cordatum]|uniref:Uncharacterized protein n=1 Tax=Prorocentrum cordatum TaxID=2364126 RepID=A0ABN9VJH5_9DINO|nr:unnamed protein product [Polarella glacialis]
MRSVRSTLWPPAWMGPYTGSGSHSGTRAKRGRAGWGEQDRRRWACHTDGPAIARGLRKGTHLQRARVKAVRKEAATRIIMQRFGVVHSFATRGSVHGFDIVQPTLTTIRLRDIAGGRGRATCQSATSGSSGMGIIVQGSCIRSFFGKGTYATSGSSRIGIMHSNATTGSGIGFVFVQLRLTTSGLKVIAISFVLMQR